MKMHHVALILAAGCMPSLAGAQTADKPLVEQKATVYSDKPADERQPDDGRTAPKELKAWVETDKAPYLVMPHRMMKGAWLGVSTSSPSPALRRQLKLPEGTGLVVDFVQPKSPAEQIGLRQYDLLLKLDDQLLINNEQLAVLVRLHKPGSEIELTVLREGERQTLSGKLAEHEVPELLFEFNDWRVTPNIKLNVDSDDKIRSLLTPAPDAPTLNKGGPVNQSDIEHSLTWLDGAKQITLKMSNDHKRLLILDRPSGKIMFEGSLDSLDQAAGLPDEARDALKRLKQFLKTQPDALGSGEKPADGKTSGDKAPREPEEKPE